MKICPKCGKQFGDDANFCPVDAARLIAVDADAARDPLLDRFELGEQLGGATTGAVHRARDKQSGQIVAVKLVSAAVMALPQVAQRIERELKQLERIESAGVAKIVASGKRAEGLWIAMEYIDGAQSLAQAIGARGPIDASKAADLVELIGEALIEAAKVGVVHRDLAPKNILFAGDQIKLVNFSVPVPLTGAGVKAPGVPEFVAPECLEGKPIDQRSNIYSLGAIHYYVLTGQTPYEGDLATVHRGHLAGGASPPSARAEVPAAVDTLVMRALDRSPSKRYLTVRQLIDEVIRVAAGGEPMPRAKAASMGGRNKPKADLVSTLTGVPTAARADRDEVVELTGAKAARAAGTNPPPAAKADLPGVAPVADAPPVAHGAATAAALAGTPLAGTAILGGAGSALAAAMAATEPPEQTRSPWAPPGPSETKAGIAPGPGETASAAAAALPAPALAAAVPLVAPSAGAAAVNATEPLGVKALRAGGPVAGPAPVMASAVAAAAVAPAAAVPVASGKKRPPTEDDKGSKGKFRETMWFKKGELDVAAAEAAAEERARTGKEAADKADTMPVEERYNDDGTLTHGDKDRYSLKSGGTQTIQAMRQPAVSGSIHRVSEGELIDEMKGSRNKIFLALFIAVIAIGALIAFAITR